MHFLKPSSLAMKINYWSVLGLIAGMIVLWICNGIAIHRNGLNPYNFFLFFSANFVWGYFWGERLLVVEDAEGRVSDEL